LINGEAYSNLDSKLCVFSKSYLQGLNIIQIVSMCNDSNEKRTRLMDSSYNIELTNWLYHVLCNHDKDLVIKSHVDRDTKYLDKIELRLSEGEDYPFECPFASIFVEINYSNRWGSLEASIKIYGKIAGIAKTNSDELKLLFNNEFDGISIKYEKLNPLFTNNTITPSISAGHSTGKHSSVIEVGARVEIKFEIMDYSYVPKTFSTYRSKKFLWNEETILCLDALKNVSKQFESINYHNCSDPDHNSEQIYL